MARNAVQSLKLHVRHISLLSLLMCDLSFMPQVYDHCPYCIRAELVLGWRAVQYERVVHGYGDTLGSDKVTDPTTSATVCWSLRSWVNNKTLHRESQCNCQMVVVALDWCRSAG